jgi:DNA-binding PadR family transcriptional regulator
MTEASCSPLAFISILDISDLAMRRSHTKVTSPLRPAVYHILLVLSAEDRHGLGIAEEIERISGGALVLGPGTLYRSLAELSEAGLIAPARARAGDADPRRKHYAITAAGRELLVRETARLGRLLETARARGILAEQE